MNARRASTLLEVLLAVSLSTVVVAAALTIGLRAADFWQLRADRQEVERVAQLVLDQLEADLSGLVWSRDGRTGLIAEVQPDQPTTGGHSGMPDETWVAAAGAVAKPTAGAGSWQMVPPLEACRFGQAGVWLRCFTVEPDSSGATPRIVAVGYQLVRRSAGAARPPVYQLFRSVVPAEVCFEVGYDLQDEAPYGRPAEPEGAVEDLRRPNPAAVLAEGVLDFGVRLTVHPDGAEPVLVFPDHESFRYAAGDGGLYPRTADVFVRVATRSGARHLQQLESTPGPARDWWRVAEANSAVFSRRIHLVHGWP